MKQLTFVLSVVAILTLAAVSSGQEPTAEDIMRKMIEACGGLDAIKKHPAGTVSFKGKCHVLDTNQHYSGSKAYVVPDKCRFQTRWEGIGTFILTCNGRKMRQTLDGKELPPPPIFKDYYGRNPLLRDSIQAIPLLLDKNDFTLTREKDLRLGDRTCYVVLVTPVKGKEDKWRLFIDKKTNLMFKLSCPGYHLLTEMPGEEEFIYEDYGKVNGIMVPHKTTTLFEGKLYFTYIYSDYRILEKIDPKLFDLGP